jgi:hypothetical protein
VLRAVLHLVLHIGAPAAVACIVFDDRRLRAWLAMTAAMIVDLDRLSSDPIYDPDR